MRPHLDDTASNTCVEKPQQFHPWETAVITWDRSNAMSLSHKITQKQEETLPGEVASEEMRPAHSFEMELVRAVWLQSLGPPMSMLSIPLGNPLATES
ncbi:hypothetical protein HGM15179_003848 [Zosterops borbonicus]|uniref:Uncharacterized protein n=1 Tax=Zosterops borbonicus TaxID=364589 RepID=A0A8K1GQ74_9PASS|nr:hypothetical protein HGM15179_003848 [Zosterops borbonicus]